MLMGFDVRERILWPSRTLPRPRSKSHDVREHFAEINIAQQEEEEAPGICSVVTAKKVCPMIKRKHLRNL